MNKQEFNRYMKEYNDDKQYRFTVNLSREKDADVIEAIIRSGDGNKNKGIKQLVRKAIKREKRESRL